MTINDHKLPICSSANGVGTNQKFECAFKERHLTVRDGYHSYQLNQNGHDRTPVPLIELKGHWLYQVYL